MDTLIEDIDIKRVTKEINDRRDLIRLKAQRSFMYHSFAELDCQFLADQVINEDDLRELKHFIIMLEGSAMKLIRNPKMSETEKGIALYILYSMYQKGLIEDWSIN